MTLNCPDVGNPIHQFLCAHYCLELLSNTTCQSPDYSQVSGFLFNGFMTFISRVVQVGCRSQWLSEYLTIFSYYLLN